MEIHKELSKVIVAPYLPKAYHSWITKSAWYLYKYTRPNPKYTWMELELRYLVPYRFEVFVIHIHMYKICYYIPWGFCNDLIILFGTVFVVVCISFTLCYCFEFGKQANTCKQAALPFGHIKEFLCLIILRLWWE